MGLRRTDASIARADANHAFISHFWGCVAQPTADGARCTTPNGMQVANRVGHVQGGILVGLIAWAMRLIPGRHPSGSTCLPCFSCSPATTLNRFALPARSP